MIKKKEGGDQAIGGKHAYFGDRTLAVFPV